MTSVGTGQIGDHTEYMGLSYRHPILATWSFLAMALLPVSVLACVAARSYRALFPRTKGL